MKHSKLSRRVISAKSNQCMWELSTETKWIETVVVRLQVASIFATVLCLKESIAGSMILKDGVTLSDWWWQEIILGAADCQSSRVLRRRERSGGMLSVK